MTVLSTLWSIASQKPPTGRNGWRKADLAYAIKEIVEGVGTGFAFQAAIYHAQGSLPLAEIFESHPKDKRMHIIVVGGGIIGATTAHACLRRGHEVTLLEAGARWRGHKLCQWRTACRERNRTMVATGLPMKMLARSWQPGCALSSALARIRRNGAGSWLLANSRAGPHHAGRMRNLALGHVAAACLQRTRAELGNDFTYDDAQKGILQLVPTGASIDLDHIRDQTARGVPVSWLDTEEIAAVEPALASAVEDGLFAGAVWGKADESGDAHLFAQRLVGAFPRARFSQHCNMAVTRIISSNGQVQGVLSAERRFDANAVIVAAGVHTRDLLAPLGVKLRFMVLRATRYRAA